MIVATGRVDPAVPWRMSLEIVPYGGWQNNARLSSAEAELIVSLEVGPRILSYRALPAGENLFKNYPAQMGGRGEAEWMIRGGHRFWLAPEHAVKTYVPDNEPVRYEFPPGETNTLIVHNDAAPPYWLEKTMSISLAERGNIVTIDHRVINRGPNPVALAPWALTVMAPGGVELIPQPPLGEHPRDLAPNRRMIVWPFTNLADGRWRFGAQLVSLRQDASLGPTKLGLLHEAGWAGYLRGKIFFFKTVAAEHHAVYADDGCNFETFTNEEMLEIETLGPLVTLAAGEDATHRERWGQHVFERASDPDDEASLAAELGAAVRASGILG